MSGLDLNDLVAHIEGLVNQKLNKSFSSLLRKNILEVFKTKGKEEILSVFLAAYDKLASQEKGEFGPLIKGKDPSALENFRHLFVKQISQELDNIRIEGNSLIIEVGNKNSWGVGRKEPLKGDPETVDFLGFYIDGVVGRFGFITMDHYKLRRRKINKGLGRFGQGFLISEEDYAKEGWERITNISFQDIIHPISGQPPYKGFDLAASSLNFNKYIEEAVKKSFTEIAQNF